MATNEHADGQRKTLALRVITPFQAFARSGSLGGLLLLLAALAALVWANTPWVAGYTRLLGQYLELSLGGWSLELSLGHWVNDGLMAVFFLLVGLELKRELVTGELARPRQAALAVAAALGGMGVPALIYVALNRGTAGLDGWAIPMATDIAFALAALSVLGSRVPLGLKVFLTALAIVDDLGAVLVIGLFYTDSLNLGALAVTGLIVVALLLLNRAGVYRLGVYLLPGVALWYVVLLSGLHATIAGVLLAFTIPIARRVTVPLAALRDAVTGGDAEAVGSRLAAVERALEQRQSPLHRLEHALHPYVNFLVLPVFAFFNAGLVLSGVGVGSVAFGVGAGLVLGKPLGVVLASLVVTRLGWAVLPEGVTWRGVLGVGFLAGIGFTMSLFISDLSFAGALYDQSRLGIIVGSLVSAGLGVAVLAGGPRRVPRP